MLDSQYILILFCLSLGLSIGSAIFLFFSIVSVNFVSIHIKIISLPPLIALLALVSNQESVILGPWHLDSLSWLIALFVLTIGLIVQRYSVRYLHGDLAYRKYFALLTFTTVADSVAWLSDDLRLMVICWGATLLGLTWLVKINKDWHVARKAARQSGTLFAGSWLLLVGVVIWIAQATGQWKLSVVLTQNSLAQLDSWERTTINLLLIVAVMIPAAQWPFQGWLLNSVVAPTPVSAIMHAGIVNAGGIILTRFSPLFDGDVAQLVLLVLSSISVLVGTGIMLVQVDYKRQLVGSTIAQMGFMLIQCALGAYLAAMIHVVLHGLFKSALFLQSGSAIPRKGAKFTSPQLRSKRSIIPGSLLGFLVGLVFWFTSPDEGYQFISALILGWSASIAWTQLVLTGQGFIGRIAGAILFAGVALVYTVIHFVFEHMLHDTVSNGLQPSMPVVLLFMVLLLAGGLFSGWLARHPSSKAFAILYLLLVRLGEPHNQMVENYPIYLKKSLSGGRLDDERHFTVR